MDNKILDQDDVFDAVSHPLRIEILNLLAKKPQRFADIKRILKIDSSGLLDFHLKKLDESGLVKTNKDGYYTVVEKGFAALQAVETLSKYGWQRRAYYINLVVCISLNIYFPLVYFFVERNTIFFSAWLLIVLPVTVAWMAFYSYWTLVKRHIRLIGKV
jgi:DNA-binding HxlR family transcriptional regulator